MTTDFISINEIPLHWENEILSATFLGEKTEVKLGIFGDDPHLELTEKVKTVGSKILETATAFPYPSADEVREICVFVSPSITRFFIKQAVVHIKEGRIEKALKKLRKADERQRTEETTTAIERIKKTVVSTRVQESSLYLSEKDSATCKQFAEFSHSHFQPDTRKLKNYEHYLEAVLLEVDAKCLAASFHYLHLAERGSGDPIKCLVKGMRLLKNRPLDYAHLLLQLNRNILLKHRSSKEIKRFLDQKDSIRMYFEAALETLRETGTQERKSCFVSYSTGEPEVTNWIRSILDPDLRRIGIEPVGSYNELVTGNGIMRFEDQIDKTDLAMLLFTPEVKEKWNNRIQNPKGVAGEIQMALDRENQNTVLPVILKGNRITSLPTPRFKDRIKTSFSDLERGEDTAQNSYHHNAFELFGPMIGVSRGDALKIRDEYLKHVNAILGGNIDHTKLKQWRDAQPKEPTIELPSTFSLQPTPTEDKHTPSICLLKAIHPHFIGREKQLDAISQNLEEQRKVILYGPAGVGKSELATKYINDHLDEYSLIWTLSCSSETSKELSYRRLAEAMNLYIDEKETLENLIWETHQKLEQNQGKPWLLFYDDMNEPIPLPSPLPCRGGDLIITSYKKDPSSPGVPVNPLSTEEAKTLISKITGEPPSEEMEDLIELTGSYPLILGRVATYISRLPDGNIKTYLKQFPDREDFLKLPPEERYQKTFNEAVEQTLKILPEKAKAWILASSYLHPKAIPISYMKKWLQRTYNEEGKTLQQTVNEVLIALSEHVLQQKQGKQLTSHPLFQDTLKLVETGEYASSICDLLLNQANWDFEYKNNYKKDFAKAVEWYQQAKAFTKHPQFVEIDAENRGNIFFFLGRVAYETLKFEKAIEYLTQSLEIFPEVDGKKHPSVATSLNNIGNCYESQGKYEEALKSHKQSLEIKEEVHGKKDPSVATSLNNIGSCYYLQGKYEEALKSHKQSLEIYREVHGKTHPLVATSLNNIGNCYKSQGKYEEALKSHKQSLEIDQGEHGKRHPSVATSLNNIGSCYESLGKYEEALKSHKQSLEIREEVHGKKHPSVATSLSNIGSCYYLQGKYEEALNIYKQSLEIYQKVHGKKHPFVATSLNNIGSCYYSQGKYEEALKSHKQSLEIREEVLGKKHPHVGTSLNNIGLCYYSQGKYEEALKSHKQSLEIREEVHGKKHPDVATSLNNIGVCYESQKNYKEALQSHNQSLKIREKVHGKKHPDVATSLNNIGCCYYSQEKYEEALKSHEQSLVTRKEVLGKKHPDVAMSLNNIGSCYESQGKYEEANEYYKRAKEIKNETYD